MSAIPEAHFGRVSNRMRREAALGEFEGRLDQTRQTDYLKRCSRRDWETGTALVYTRDVRHHTSGWFKNPDYERCLHLSMHPIGDIAVGPGVRELDADTRARWLEAFFREHVRLAWKESAKTERGRELAVQHWRVFCDSTWAPILPRGEVYGTELTEKGWKSSSELGIVIESPLVPG